MKPSYIILCAFLSFSTQWVNGGGSPSSTVPPRNSGVTVIGSTSRRPIVFNKLVSPSSTVPPRNSGVTVIGSTSWRPIIFNKLNSRCVKPLIYEDCLENGPTPLRVCVEIESSFLNNFDIVYTCVKVKLSNDLRLELPCIYLDNLNATVLDRELVYSKIQENADINICRSEQERIFGPSPKLLTVEFNKI